MKYSHYIRFHKKGIISEMTRNVFPPFWWSGCLACVHFACFHSYEYRPLWHIALFCFPEMSSLLPRGVWIRNILCYPETRIPLKGSVSENACIGPVGAEFRWGRRVSIISSISLFFFPICTLFPWNTCILRPCSEIECAECNSVSAPLGAV